MDDRNETPNSSALNGIFDIRIGDSIKSTSSSSPAATCKDKTKGTFHSFRYNFAPDSVDKSQGELSVGRKGEATLKLASLTKAHEEHLFKGTRTICNENDFLLIFDPDTNEFVLEKRASDWKLLNIRGGGKRSAPCADSDEEGSTIPSGSIIRPQIAGNPPTAPFLDRPEAEEDTFSDLEATLLEELDHS